MDCLAATPPTKHNQEVDLNANPDVTERALLSHLALIGELAERREQLRNDVLMLDQLLAQARQRRAVLVQQVQAMGGRLPTWDLRDLSSQDERQPHSGS